jgi:hypothetical protein
MENTLDTLEIFATDGGGENTYVILPPDSYQFQIVSVELRDSNFKGEMKKQLEWKAQLCEEGEYKGKELMFWTSLAWSFGGTKKDGTTLSPSKLGTLFKAVYRLYKPDLKVEEIKKVTGSSIKNLVGKQVRLTVDEVVKENKVYNKVTGFLPAKAVIEGYVPVVNEKKEVEKIEEVKEEKPTAQATPVAQSLEGDDIPF